LPTGPSGRQIFLQTAKELGYRVKDGAIIFSSEVAMDRLCDFLIYEPTLPQGKSLAQQYLESGPDIPEIETAVLRAAAVARTSLFETVEIAPSESRFLVRDLLQECSDFWITDINLSRTIKPGGLIFTRVLQVNEICFSTGAAVCFGPESKQFLLRKNERIEKIKNPVLRSRKQLVLFVSLEKFSSITLKLG
jgi:hypothetical protein